MSKKNYLIYTITSWNEPPRARHQVSNELKNEGVVYFVEKNQVGFPRIEIKRLEENLYIITPYYFLSNKVRYRIPLINEQYHTWLLQKIAALNIDFEMIITFDFTAPAVTRRYTNTIFYCADENVGTGNFNPWITNKYHTKTEKKIAENARVCVVTSDYMKNKISRYNENTFLVPLGAPAVVLKEVQPPNKSKSLPKLGVVGFLDKNMDYNLIKKLLEKFTVAFIGPISKKNYNWLSAIPNAIITGPKNGNDLYNYLHNIDVCIAPYDIKKINKGSTPNKLWLYLALGKPAVVTNMPNIENWHFGDGLVYKCKNEDFVETCINAYKQNSLELALKRVEIAKQNSWNNRVENIKRLYTETTQNVTK